MMLPLELQHITHLIHQDKNQGVFNRSTCVVQLNIYKVVWGGGRGMDEKEVRMKKKSG